MTVRYEGYSWHKPLRSGFIGGKNTFGFLLWLLWKKEVESIMRRLCLVLVLLLLLGIPTALADIIVFTSYDTRTTLEDGYLTIDRDVILKNVGNAPIIPGELHFKLHEVLDDGTVGPDVQELSAFDQYETELRTNVIKTDKQTDLVVSVWNPLLPEFTYPLTVRYRLEFEPKGILFYEINVPVEETTIPIQSLTNEFYIPSKYSVTYAKDASISNDGQYDVVKWQGRSIMNIEYSRMPLPKLPVRGVNLFWLTLIILLLIPFGLKVIKALRNR